MRRVALASSKVLQPTGTEPYMTEYGYSIGPPPEIQDGGGDGDLNDDETVYEIDKVISAERIGNIYKCSSPRRTQSMCPHKIKCVASYQYDS